MVFWVTLLFVVHYIITIIEERVGLVRFSIAYQRPCVTVPFLGLSALGLWNGLLWWGSAQVLAYVVAGVWTWQCLARPMEEEDMRRHFDHQFKEYNLKVR